MWIDANLQLHRRQALRAAGGFGLLALGDMLRADTGGAIQPHHPPKARRVIQLFMNGGVSQMDTFDYKPELEKRHGQKVDVGLQAAATSLPGPMMKSPFPWKQHGQCGRWVTDRLPHLAKKVDSLAFLMAMASRSNVHGPASYLANTGFQLPGFPCAGAWIGYALGRITDNLPTFMVLPDARGLPYNGMGNFSAGFLPATHQGTVINPEAPVPIADLKADARAPFATAEASQDGLKLLQDANRRFAESRPGDTRLEARLQMYEMAARMQASAPEAFDLSRETTRTLENYGANRPGPEWAFARNCLLARRLVERGTRFVQVWSGAGGPSNNWDNHTDIPKELPPICKQVDQPAAALLDDLASRGLLNDTLVLWTTEFGRMPFTQGSVGRDHNGGTSVAWMAGAGVKGGTALGASDDFSYQAAENKTSIHDLHATLLHLLGIDHEKLTVLHNGTNRRLTDVHGRVLTELLV